MKKFIFSAIAAIGLLLSPSCSDENEALSGSGNEALVSFNVNLADGISTKAISDGKTVNILHVRVFEDNSGSPGTLLSLLSKDNIPVSDKTATATMQLVKGKKYHLLFWADCAETGGPYTIETDGTITVSYALATCNDEKRDAFFATHTVTVPNESTFTENTIKLKRPFAQLNFLVPASEITTAKAMGLDFSDARTEVVVTGAASTFDPFNQTASGSEIATFTNGTIPFAAKLAENKLTEADNLTSINGGTPYYYLATNYILVGTALTDITLTLTDGGDTRKVPVANAPVAQNYRTNIFGKMLTEQGTITVKLSPGYETEDLTPSTQP